MPTPHEIVARSVCAGIAFIMGYCAHVIRMRAEVKRQYEAHNRKYAEYIKEDTK